MEYHFSGQSITQSVYPSVHQLVPPANYLVILTNSKMAPFLVVLCLHIQVATVQLFGKSNTPLLFVMWI